MSQFDFPRKPMKTDEKPMKAVENWWKLQKTLKQTARSQLECV